MSDDPNEKSKGSGSRDLTGLFETTHSLDEAPAPVTEFPSTADLSQEFDPNDANAPAIADGTLPGPSGADEMPLIETDPLTGDLQGIRSIGEAHASPQSAASADTMNNIREYSEKLEVGRPQVEASFPFSLLIEGELTPSEKDKLSELLTREGMGIRELDLDPQLEAGRILIPRISEYAGVLIVQSLRTSRARMRLGPADSIFQSRDAERSADSDDDLVTGHPQMDRVSVHLANHGHPAERLVVTTDDTLPEGGAIRVLDAISASAHLRTGAIEAETSEEYQAVLEALQREIKYKAYRKGADAVVGFSVTLTPLSDPSRYRLTALGSAIKTLK